jgi:hypothetical protein
LWMIFCFGVDDFLLSVFSSSLLSIPGEYFCARKYWNMLCLMNLWCQDICSICQANYWTSVVKWLSIKL